MPPLKKWFQCQDSNRELDFKGGGGGGWGGGVGIHKLYRWDGWS